MKISVENMPARKTHNSDPYFNGGFFMKVRGSRLWQVNFDNIDFMLSEFEHYLRSQAVSG